MEYTIIRQYLRWQWVPRRLTSVRGSIPARPWVRKRDVVGARKTGGKRGAYNSQTPPCMDAEPDDKVGFGLGVPAFSAGRPVRLRPGLAQLLQGRVPAATGL